MPFQVTRKRPAGARRSAIVATLTPPEAVSTVASTRAAWASVTPAWIVCCPRTRTTIARRESFVNPSVELTVNDWLAVELRPRSSEPVTSSRHLPSAGAAGGSVGSSEAGGNATG